MKYPRLNNQTDSCSGFPGTLEISGRIAGTIPVVQKLVNQTEQLKAKTLEIGGIGLKAIDF